MRNLNFKVKLCNHGLHNNVITCCIKSINNCAIFYHSTNLQHLLYIGPFCNKNMDIKSLVHNVVSQIYLLIFSAIQIVCLPNFPYFPCPLLDTIKSMHYKLQIVMFTTQTYSTLFHGTDVDATNYHT